MKDGQYTIPHLLQVDAESLVPLYGFAGYYVDRFNGIYSFRSAEGTLLAPYQNQTKDRVLECVVLVDNEGKRRFRSRRKILVESYGNSFVANMEAPLCEKEVMGTIKKYGSLEFERREKLRGNKALILEKEQRAVDIWQKAADHEHQKMLDEMHKDDFSGPEVPLQSLDPLIRKLVGKARKRKAEALGELF